MAVVVPESTVLVVLHVLSFSYTERTVLRIGDRSAVRRTRGVGERLRGYGEKMEKKAETKLEKEKEQNLRK